MASLLQNAETAVLSKIPGADPRPAQKAQAFSGMNDGPAVTASRLTGLTQKDVARDDASLYTSAFRDPLFHSLNVGGIPTTIDTALFEKQQTFNRSKTRERIVHPCGSAAFGSFTVTNDVSKYTKADFLQPGTVTPVFTRFSTVTYGREFADSARNPRGMATKFYTTGGNYDLVGLNWPSFFVREPFMGPDVIRSQQRNPRNFLIDYNAWFDFLANVPESNYSGALLLSDEGTPVGWKHMNGFGCHTFRWTNKEGGSVFVKYHWICQQEKKNFTYDDAVRMCGEDPDYAKRDLWEYIENGNAARWTMKVQLMTPEEATTVDFDPFDVTKFWPESQFPLVEVGELKLDRNPEDYHRDVEQAAFSPGSLVPGIELSPDSLLCWRAWFYRDTQYDRLGSANIHQIPVNCPFMAKQHSPDNYAGNMRVDGNTLSKPVYFPNSYHSKAPTTDTTPSFDVTAVETPMQVASNVLSRKSHYRHEGQPSEYWAAKDFYLNQLNAQGRANLHSNTSRLLKFADEIVKKNYLIQLYAISPDYANGVYEGLPEKPKTFAMDEVAEASKTAHLVGKNPQFQLKNAGAGFMGMGIPASSQYSMDSTPDKQ
uniref:BY PROTMAP: gi/751835684/emb/CEL54483.1/ catalase [Rhizoctonia solani AG-1 IB] n=1 Tax=Rhodotorula toruloides TaxID=5286 RepID=A0A0K3CG83_RHOTO